MIYIRATGNISPQKTFGQAPFLTEPVEHAGNRLTCIEPDYNEIIDAKLIRRMSRVIKMGVAAAMQCLRAAGVETPNAVIIGTAYGCLRDTEVFLTKIVENQEEMLPPTAFIQSTHNTVGAQIALMLQCHGYNNTFVHRGSSFESAVLDAMMLLLENPDDHILIGAVDEITNTSHSLLSRMGLYRRGTVAGEGAAFFLLAGQPSPTDNARLEAITTFYDPGGLTATEQSISDFLASRSISINDIDLIITGRNGDEKNDLVYDQLQQSVLKGPFSVNYKDQCGEYPSSAGFALWLAATILQTGRAPAAVSSQLAIRRILIYNYHTRYHSLLLVSAC